jgi:hypothetical protein
MSLIGTNIDRDHHWMNTRGEVLFGLPAGSTAAGQAATTTRFVGIRFTCIDRIVILLTNAT